MKRTDKVILTKIRTYCGQIHEALDMFGDDRSRFTSSSVFQNACCMCILQIGELCKLLSDEAKEVEASVPWREWCGIRDVFAHNYSNLDTVSTWEAIHQDLPLLEEAVGRMLQGVIKMERESNDGR